MPAEPVLGAAIGVAAQAPVVAWCGGRAGHLGSRCAVNRRSIAGGGRDQVASWIRLRKRSTIGVALISKEPNMPIINAVSPPRLPRRLVTLFASVVIVGGLFAALPTVAQA